MAGGPEIPDVRRRPVTVLFLPQGITVEARTGDTVLDAALDNGIPLGHECGGNCTCTTCHVHVLEGGERLSRINEPEAYRLDFASGKDETSRLACQALLQGSVTVSIPDPLTLDSRTAEE